jgi:glutathione S-transferase
MKIYGFPLSPFVRKVLVTLKEKRLDAELVPSNPNQPDPEFSAVSPFHKIPAFRDGDFTIADSTAIVTYLDAKYPEPALLPSSPEARARAVWFEEVADTVLIPTAAPIVVNRFLRPLDYLESKVTDEWLDTEFSIGDVAVASAFRTLGYAGWTLDASAYPRIAAWYGRVTQRAGWQAAAAQEDALFAASGL